MSMEIYEEVVRLKKEGRASALATIVQCVGSSPQKEGAKMLVRDDGSIVGTMGGGCLEAEVIQASVMTIRDGSPRTVPIELTERHGGLVCGGKVLVYIEPVIPEPRLIILGAGHVGRALAGAATFAGFRTTVADDREEYANRENIPDADEIVVHGFGDMFARIFVDESAYIVIATRGHNHDLDALKAALGTKAKYIGLLGSRRKRALLFKTLREAGFLEVDIERIVTPVGLAIGSVTPEEIAISIMAQIIQKRRESIASGIGVASCGGVGKKNGEAETTSPSC
ncbi:MAG: XdhC/CoxI family protein [Nitrospiraceae bacterium]|nr:XdhC/CoxI family protein [Nitrospiraceae bacterium]